MDAARLIDDLDPDQRAAVTSEARLVAVIAGAGSGKTRVLTRRVAHRIATGSADARHTLVLTFTREAAGELRRRLRSLGIRDHVEAGTFHSVMLGVLRQRWSDLDRAPQAVSSDRRRLVKAALAEIGRPSRRDLESALGEIEWAGARGLGASGYASAARRESRRPNGGIDEAQQAIAAYEALKRSRGVLDFDDVLTRVLDEAERDREFADVLRWRFRHLLVDEAQDLNPVQHRIVDLLRGGRDDLFLVGDPSQAIFGFNGSDPRLLTAVETTFPGVEIIRLPVNHRCTPQIVSAATHVLGAVGPAPDLVARRHDGPQVAMIRADDEHDEAARVARMIVRGDPLLVRSGQVAVLARTNAQLAAFELALTDVGVAVRRRANADGSPLQASMRRATESTSPSALRAWAHDTLDDHDALSMATARVERIERALTEPAGSSRSPRPNQATVADARRSLAEVESDRRVANAALDFLRDRPRGDGAEFRGWVATTNPFDDSSTEGVELMSFHAAKGREWHTVFVTGVETSLVPHRSATTNDARAEEARLLYVAMTRAGDQLVVSSAERRAGYARKVSPFVDRLDLSEPVPQPPPRKLIRQRRESSPIGALREWRRTAAIRANVLPVQLVSDRDLNAIATRRPSTADELAEATTMGRITAERLAPEILAALD